MPSPAPISLTRSATPGQSQAPSTLASRIASPAVSKAPTPRSEPIQQQRILTVNEVTTMFLKSLLGTAQDFLGEPVKGAVISIPSSFDNNARDGLIACAKDAGIEVLQLLDDIGAAASMIVEPIESSNESQIDERLPSDRTSLVIDIGSSVTHLNLLAIREGLVHTVGTSDAPVGGDSIDDKLIAWFAKEFTKKTKVKFNLPASDDADKRAEAKLRLAVEFTKRTLSASPGAASCSVESLKDGYDLTGTINRLRFDLEMRPIYSTIVEQINVLLKESGLDHIQIDELVFVGGSAALPGLREAIQLIFPENTHVGTYGEETSQVLAKGCAYQAQLISRASNVTLLPSLHQASERVTNLVHASATTKNIGIKISPDDNSTYRTVIEAGTPVPVRREFNFGFTLPIDGEENVVFPLEIWESSSRVHVEQPARPAKTEKPPTDEEDAEADEDDEEEEEPVRTKVDDLTTRLGSLSLPVRRSKVPSARQNITVEITLERDGLLTVSALEDGREGQEKTKIEIR